MRAQRTLSHTSSNALDHWHLFKHQMSGRRLVLMLDYDGTLTPIVNDPAKAFLPESTREMLQTLSSMYITGVVSGRSLEKVTSFVGVDELFYAGSHGFDIQGPGAGQDASTMRHQVAMEFLPALALAGERLATRLAACSLVSPT